jgi:hypothetical protein
MKKADQREHDDRLNSNNFKSFKVTSPSQKNKRIIGKLVADCSRLRCGSAVLPVIEKKIKQGRDEQG